MGMANVHTTRVYKASGKARAWKALVWW